MRLLLILYFIIGICFGAVIAHDFEACWDLRWPRYPLTASDYAPHLFVSVTFWPMYAYGLAATYKRNKEKYCIFGGSFQ